MTLADRTRLIGGALDQAQHLAERALDWHIHSIDCADGVIEYIVANLPGTQLRAIEADRRVLHRHTPGHPTWGGCYECGRGRVCREVADLADRRSVDITAASVHEPECPCFCFELDPDVDQDGDDPDQLLCECSHTLGEHDAHGDCKAAAVPADPA